MSTLRIAAVPALAAVCALGACTDRFFAPGASERPAGLAIAATWAPAGGSAAAFDRADAIRVQVAGTAALLLDTTLAFRAGASETRVLVPVTIANATQSVLVQVDLRSAGSPIFSGKGSGVLVRGETTPIAIALAPVAGGIVVAALPPLTALGDTAWAQGAIVFATGDTIGGARPTWSSLTPAIVTVSPDGMLVARSEGQGRLQAAYGEAATSVDVSVSAVVSSILVTPRADSAVAGAGGVQFAATARDRRGNALARIFAWSSSNETAASVDAAGLATPRAVGVAFITAAVGAVRDSARLVVTAGQAPVLSNGSVSLIQAVDPACYHAGTGLTGSSHRLSFDFADVDGNVVMAVGALSGTWVGYPSGSGGSIPTSAMRDPAFTGTASRGQVQFTLCFIFRTDTYDDVTVNLTDAAGLAGQLAPIRIFKPSGGY